MFELQLGLLLTALVLVEASDLRYRRFSARRKGVRERGRRGIETWSVLVDRAYGVVARIVLTLTAFIGRVS